MKAWRTPLITFGLLASIGTSTFAQMGPGMHGSEGHPGPRMEKMREFMGERHQKHLLELKSRLKLEPAQENAWNTFAEAMQPPAHAMAKPDRAALSKLTTPERIDQMQAMHGQREAEMKKRGDAVKTFYASLNAEQKKTFDDQTARMMGSGHGRHGHPH